MKKIMKKISTILSPKIENYNLYYESLSKFTQKAIANVDLF